MNTETQMTEEAGPYNSLRSYVSTMLHAVPRKAAIAMTLMLVVSLTEWLGLVMLIPLLVLAGIDVGTGMAGEIASGASAVIGRLGFSPSVLTVLVLYVAVVAMRATLARALALATIDLEKSFQVHLRKRMYSAVINSRWLFFSRRRSSDFLHAVIGQCTSVTYATGLVLRLVSSVLVGLVYLFLAIQLSPLMTVLAVAAGLLLLFLLRKGTERARYHAGEMTQSVSRLLGAMTEHLGGMKTVKSYGAEERNIAVFGGLVEHTASAYMEQSRNFSFVRLWFEIGSTVVLCSLLYVAISILSHSTGEILLLLFVFARLVPRFSGIQQLYQSFVAHMPSFSIVMTLMDRCEAEAEQRLPRSGVAPSLNDGIRLDSLSFRYLADDGAQTLETVDLDIPARRTTAIVGPSGAGKSTIADLIMGLLTPDTGRVLIDDAVLGPETMSDWRDQIGYVPQDTFLFHDTVRGNLLWACPDASEEDIVEALRLAAAHDFVIRLPQGLDTVIGDRGVLLSGGERQRIALTRALLRKPSLLILDEATSALDSENELRIQRAIEQLHGRMTILIITHRLSTIRRADMIHVIENGRLVESGTWQTLINQHGRFGSLCAAQGFIEEPRDNGAVVPLSRAATLG